MDQPLILTLQLDQAAQAFYDDLRQRFFPPDRNFISAHLTLFHQLPDEDMIYQTLDQLARSTAKISLTDASPRSIGHGVAVFFQAPALITLHRHLSDAFKLHLIPQDLQRLQPHIVVQNKVNSETARHTLLQFKTHPLIEPQAIGLTVWRYLGGPWERLMDVPFATPDVSQHYLEAVVPE